MDDQLVHKVLEKYGLTPSKIFPEQKGYRNHCRAVELHDGRMVNIILYKNELHILQFITDADTVSGYLANTGLPARKRIGSLLKLSTPGTVRYVGLYNYLPGETIQWEAYTKDHIKALGATMSAMHSALQQFRYPPATQVALLNAGLADGMIEYFQQQDVRDALSSKLSLTLDTSIIEAMKAFLTKLDHLPSQQILHMDFVRGNILFQPSSGDLKHTVSGVIDFEKTAFGHPVFDVARTLAFLMADCERKPYEKIYKYFLRSGYNKRGQTRFCNPVVGGVDVLEYLVSWYLLHDLYKFLRHTPYESLPSNHHFVRTRDILIAKKLLKYS